ncbi:MAG: hypothetical protein U0Q12_09070 [Vicinamibacterales bacterium]
MTDRTRVMLAALGGALAGGVLGYLYLTDEGRRLRERLEPALGNLADEVGNLNTTVGKAVRAADEGLRSIVRPASPAGASTSAPGPAFDRTRRSAVS